jgi:hypothetical protein
MITEDLGRGLISPADCGIKASMTTAVGRGSTSPEGWVIKGFYDHEGSEVPPGHPRRTDSIADRCVAFMGQTGIRTDPASGAEDDDGFRDPVVALLGMLTLAFGIRLSREDASALLTSKLQIGGPGLR